MIVKYKYKSNENIMGELKSGRKNEKAPVAGGLFLIVVY
jgi:hypothetical protein